MLEACFQSCLPGPSSAVKALGLFQSLTAPGSNCKGLDLFCEEPAGDLRRVWLAQGIITLQAAGPSPRWGLTHKARFHFPETWVLCMRFHIQQPLLGPDYVRGSLWCLGTKRKGARLA